MYVSIEGQGHFLTLAKGHLYMKVELAIFNNHWAIFSQILNVSLKVQKMKIHKHNAGHVTKMATCHYMVKHFKNLLPRNHWADFYDTLYEASEA